MLLGHPVHVRLSHPHFINATVASGHKGEFMPPSAIAGALLGLCISGTPGGGGPHWAPLHGEQDPGHQTEPPNPEAPEPGKKLPKEKNDQSLTASC